MNEAAAITSQLEDSLALAEPASVDQATAGMSTKADKIRTLARAGYLRTEIAALLQIRYQHVRQVLERSGISAGRQKQVAAIGKASKSVIVTDEPRLPEAAQEFPVDRLIEAGFVKIGRWSSVSDDAFVLDSAAPKDAGVYAFVVDGIITYVGLTQRGLRTRMGHYVRGHARQRTSSRIKALIIEALRVDRVVEVLAAAPGDMAWNGLPVMIAPGLEAGLIRLIQPSWNMQGVGQR